MLQLTTNRETLTLQGFRTGRICQRRWKVDNSRFANESLVCMETALVLYQGILKIQDDQQFLTIKIKIGPVTGIGKCSNLQELWF